MNIAHIVCTYPPYYGGMGNVVYQIASEQSSRGNTVEVLTPGVYEEKELRGEFDKPAKEHEVELEDRIDYGRRLKPSLHYGNAARLSQIKSILNEFDLVHLHYPFFGTANLVREWKQKHKNRPLVITYHMDTRGPGWKGLIFKWYSTYWMPKILSSADAVTCNSIDYIKNSDAAGEYDKHRSSWFELPFGVDLKRFSPHPKNTDLFKLHSLDANFPIALFVGGMDEAHYFKGIQVLLKALHATHRAGVSPQLVLVGDGHLRPEFEQMAHNYGLDNVVRFVGHVSDKDLPEYYSLADLCILPSIHQGEAFGMVLLEAMASGVPVLASDLPGVRTIALKGGDVVPPNNPGALAEAMIAYFSSPAKALYELSHKARRVCEEMYSWSRIVDTLDTIYVSAVERCKRA